MSDTIIKSLFVLLIVSGFGALSAAWAIFLLEPKPLTKKILVVVMVASAMIFFGSVIFIMNDNRQTKELLERYDRNK